MDPKIKKIIVESIKESWTVESAHPKFKSKWNKRKPETGQCGVTSILINELFGGYILYCRSLNHYWNYIGKGEFIDLTKGQFLASEEVTLDDIFTREGILKTESVELDSLFIRYNVFRRFVMNKLADQDVSIANAHYFPHIYRQYERRKYSNNPKLENPISGRKLIFNFVPTIPLNTRLLLFTSNSSEQYTQDALRVLAAPENFIMHFRYQLKLLPTAMTRAIPLRNGSGPNTISDYQGIVVFAKYLNPDGEGGSDKWENYVPLRNVDIIDAYRTGDGERDIAHIYFRLKEHVDIAKYDKELRAKHSVQIDALTSRKLFLVPDDTITSSFFCTESNAMGGLNKLFTETVENDILYQDRKFNTFYVNRLFDVKTGETIKQEYDQKTNQSFFPLEELNRYIVEYGNFSPEAHNDPYTINFTCERTHFINPSSTGLEVTSTYNQEHNWLMPKYLQYDTVSNIHIKTKARKDNRRLDFALILPINISRTVEHRIRGYVRVAVGPIMSALFGFFLASYSHSNNLLYLILVGAIPPLWLGLILFSTNKKG